MKNVLCLLSRAKITAVRMQQNSAIGVCYHGSQLPTSIVLYRVRGGNVMFSVACKMCSEHISISATQSFAQTICSRQDCLVLCIL